MLSPGLAYHFVNVMERQKNVMRRVWDLVEYKTWYVYHKIHNGLTLLGCVYRRGGGRQVEGVETCYYVRKNNLTGRNLSLTS